jgi:glycosyltransferase involved in cell wall biosynthesis
VRRGLNRAGEPATAVLHDYFLRPGGAERVAGRIAQTFPEAVLLTSAWDRRRVSLGAAGGRPWGTGYLQPLASKAGVRPLFPLLPSVFESFDLSGSGLVLSSSSGFAHHARKEPGALHVVYCHTPPRFLWRPEEYFRGRERLGRLLAPMLRLLRRKDGQAASRADLYVAVSEHIGQRIREVYGLPSRVVYPPVDCGRFKPSKERNGRFLVVSRLVAAKHVDLVVEAANRYSLPLDVIGEGPESARLRRQAGPTVRFMGWRNDSDVAEAMAAATAVVVAGEEDFGLVTAEAQASGSPPVAFRRGGAAEIVEDGVTGYLFDRQEPALLAEAMMRARDHRPLAADLVASALRFDIPVFREGLGTVLAEVMGGISPVVEPRIRDLAAEAVA